MQFQCDLAQPSSPLPHFWEHTVGSDHAPIALRADWQSQLIRCRKELGFRHVRFHGILSDDMGTLICQNEKLLYSFFNADQICNFLLANGMKPFVELGFMPKTLSSGNETVFRYQANVTPPKDYGEWSTLIKKLTAHWADRYGAAEVKDWFFEVWNEPNLKSFWTGSREEYFKLYRTTAEAIKGVNSAFRVGGPATAKNEWIEDFLHYCETNGVPADFIGPHNYPTDVVSGTSLGKEGDDTESHLARSPRSIMRKWASEVNDQAKGRPVYYTEWNTSSNPRDPRHDEPFAAAFVIKTIMEAHGLVEGYSFWTFSDIFAENYFPSVPFQGGFGLLTIQGIAKPTYRAFELLHRLGTDKFAVEGEHSTVDCWVVRGENTLQILLTNLAMPRHPIETENIRLRISALTAAPQTAFVERIDEENANPKTLWKELGSPTYLSESTLGLLNRSSELSVEQIDYSYDAGILELNLVLPAQAVAAVTFVLSKSASAPGEV